MQEAVCTNEPSALHGTLAYVRGRARARDRILIEKGNSLCHLRARARLAVRARTCVRVRARMRARDRILVEKETASSTRS